jgi:hypothetical protein
LIRQLLAETFLLTAVGAVFGLGLSVFLGRVLRSLLPEATPASVSFSPAIVAMLIALALIVTILCGAAPAFHATGADLNSSLKAGNSSMGGAAQRRGFTPHEIFAGGQLILAIMLLVSTGLLLRSMMARIQFPLGFDPNNIVVVHTENPAIPELRAAWREQRHYKINDPEFTKIVMPAEEADVEQKGIYYSRTIETLSRLPGVESVAFMNPLPFPASPVSLPDGMAFFSPHGGAWAFCNYRNMSANAFQVLGIPILAGRTFLPEDIPSTSAWNTAFVAANDRSVHNVPFPQSAAVVNATFARRYWPNQNPLGKELMSGQGLRMKVVGVARDIHESREQMDIVPTVYVPVLIASRFNGAYNFVVKLRSGVSSASFAKTVKREVPPFSSDAPPLDIHSLREPANNLPWMLALLSCFSVMGIVVAGLGVYTTAMLMSASRTREMGIRLAIGASAEQVGRLVLWRSVRLALLALPVGAFGAWILGLSLKHWLFQVGTTDPVSYFTSAAILLAIALAAGLWPALRAATTDPSTALRYDG